MKLSFLLPLFILLTSIVVFPLLANGQSSKNVSVDLVLNSIQEKDKTGIVSPTLIIMNSDSTEVKVEHPGNRMAVAFIVMNSLGNIVSPVALAKVDPFVREIIIKPNSQVKVTLPNLNFITGSALFGYELKTGEIYRVVAIYRPTRGQNLGITTQEQVITVK